MRTVADMDKAFKLYVDRADSQGATDFLPGERQQFLNDAQLRLAQELVTTKTDNQDAVDLRRRLSAYGDLPVGNANYSYDNVALPDNYLSYGMCRAQLAFPYGNYQVKVNIVSENEFSAAQDDVFNKPSIGEPLGCFLQGEIQVLPRAALFKLFLSYYKQPTELDLTTPTQVPDLQSSLLPTVVQYAVQLALESVESPRTGTQAQIAQLTSPN